MERKMKERDEYVIMGLHPFNGIESWEVYDSLIGEEEKAVLPARFKFVKEMYPYLKKIKIVHRTVKIEETPWREVDISDFNLV